MKQLLFILGLCFFLNSLAQSNSIEGSDRGDGSHSSSQNGFHTYIFDPSNQISIFSGVATSDGSYLLGGLDGFKSILIKYSENKGIEWSKLYDSISITAITETIDGGFAIVGSNNSSLANLNLLKIDSVGNPQWSKDYHGSIRLVNDITQNNDGELLIIGAAELNPNTSSQRALIRLDEFGNLIDSKVLAIPNRRFDKVINTRDQGNIIIGTGIGSSSNISSLSKLDSNGNIEWYSEYAVGNGISFANQVLEHSGGDFLIGGQSYTPLFSWLLRVNSMGALEWIKAYGGGGIHAIQESSNNNLFLGNWPNPPLAISQVSARFLLVDSLGEEIITSGIGGPPDEYPEGILSLDNSITMFGPSMRSASFGFHFFSIFPHLICADTFTTTSVFVPPYTYTLQSPPATNNLPLTIQATTENDSTIILNEILLCSPSTEVSLPAVEELLQIYPNPSSGVFQILSPQLNSSNTEIIIRNLNGKPLQRIINNAETQKLDLSDLASGIYLIEVVSDKEIFRKKIIKNE